MKEDVSKMKLSSTKIYIHFREKLGTFSVIGFPNMFCFHIMPDEM